MKSKLLSLIAIIFLAASCSTKISLVKRKYNKGFYIASAGKKDKQQVSPAASAHKKAAQHSKNASFSEEHPVQVIARQAQASPVAKTPPVKPLAQPVQEKRQAPSLLASGMAAKAMTPQFHAFKTIQVSTTASKSSAGSDVDLIILVILAIFIPPLGVYLKTKSINKWFWITLILCILSFGVLFASGLGSLLYLAASVIALLYVLDMIS